MSIDLTQLGVGNYEGSNVEGGFDFVINMKPDQDTDSNFKYVIDFFDLNIEDTEDAYLDSFGCDDLAEALDAAFTYVKTVIK